MGFRKFRRTFLGARIIRTTAFGCLYLGHPIGETTICVLGGKWIRCKVAHKAHRLNFHADSPKSVRPTPFRFPSLQFSCGGPRIECVWSRNLKGSRNYVCYEHGPWNIKFG